MFEKIKDFFYDINDLLIAILLIIIIVFSISYKVTDAFSVNIFDDKGSKDDYLASLDDADFNSGDAQQPAESPDTTTDGGDDTATDTEKPAENTEKPAVTGETVKFSIPSGSTGYSIATTLVDKGLVESKEVFLKRVDELKLAPKLRSGDFSIPSGTSLDDIIYIIAGKKRL